MYIHVTILYCGGLSKLHCYSNKTVSKNPYKILYRTINKSRLLFAGGMFIT